MGFITRLHPHHLVKFLLGHFFFLHQDPANPSKLLIFRKTSTNSRCFFHEVNLAGHMDLIFWRSVFS